MNKTETENYIQKQIQNNLDSLKKHGETNPVVLIAASIGSDGSIALDISKNVPISDLFFLNKLLDRLIEKTLEKDIFDSLNLEKQKEMTL